MSDTLPIPDAASEKDRQRIEHVNRNLRIRQQYPQLRAKHGWERASELLADRHGVSKSTVRKVLKGYR